MHNNFFLGTPNKNGCKNVPLFTMEGKLEKGGLLMIYVIR